MIKKILFDWIFVIILSLILLFPLSPIFTKRFYVWIDNYQKQHISVIANSIISIDSISNNENFINNINKIFIDSKLHGIKVIKNGNIIFQKLPEYNDKIGVSVTRFSDDNDTEVTVYVAGHKTWFENYFGYLSSLSTLEVFTKWKYTDFLLANIVLCFSIWFLIHWFRSKKKSRNINILLDILSSK